MRKRNDGGLLVILIKMIKSFASCGHYLSILIDQSCFRACGIASPGEPMRHKEIKSSFAAKPANSWRLETDAVNKFVVITPSQLAVARQNRVGASGEQVLN